MNYLNNEQINEMAHAAFTSYEFTADWGRAAEAAAEYAADEFGVKPRKSAALLAVKIAKTMWMGEVFKMQKAAG